MANFQGKINCYFLKNIYIFWKSIKLFSKGNNKKITLFGNLLTASYGLIYLVYFLYKLIRMLKKKDFTFYDIYAYIDEPPIMNITNENFYGGFAIEDPNSYDLFLDAIIYYLKAYFKIAKSDGENWYRKIKEILERCNIVKFGSVYQENLEVKLWMHFIAWKKLMINILAIFVMIIILFSL